jgi:HNH endonuclease
MNPHYPVVAHRAGHRCEYCHAPEAIFNFPFEVEHIIPLSRSGVDAESNLALACRSCNLFKADHITGFDEFSGSPVRLFHPRQDIWDQHFRVDASGTIDALSEIGRGTILRLRINEPSQLRAREKWIRAGLLP